jgi:hypothetical protein
MQKYVIVTFLEDVSDEAEFPMSAWPFHVTLAANFVINKPVDQLNEMVADFAKSYEEFNAIAGDDDHFGPEGKVLVTKLEMNPQLKVVHEALISLLESTGALFDQPQYNNEGYIAHATVWHEKRLNKGDKVLFDTLSIVDMFPHSDIKQRKVLATFNFRKSSF